MTAQSLLTLTIPPTAEEALVDWLLQSRSHSGFSSYPVNGHSSREDGLSLAEQVAGRQQQIRLQLHINTDDLTELLAGLKQEFTGTNMHYWVSPLSETGHI